MCYFFYLRQFLFVSLVIISLLKVSSNCDAQKADSLLRELSNSKNDTNKVNTLIRLSILSMEEGRFDDELSYAEQAQELSEKLQWENGKGRSQAMIGSAYDDMGKIELAESNYLKAVKTFRDSYDYNLMVTAYFDLGFVFHRNNDLSSALEYYKKAHFVFQYTGNKKKIAEVLSSIGGIHYRKGDYPDALKHYFRSLKIHEELNDVNSQAACFNNIANVHYQLQEYEKALDYYSKAYFLHEKMGDEKRMAQSSSNLGIVNTELGNFEEAIIRHNYALEIFEKMDAKAPKARTLYNLANTFHAMKELEKSLIYCNKAIEIYENTRDERGLAYSLIKTGQVYLESGKIQLSKVALSKSLSIATKLNEKEVLKLAYSEIWRADSASKNYLSSLENYKLYIVYRDSLRNEEVTKEVIQSQVNYEYEKKKAADSIKIDEERKLSIFKLESEKKQKKYLYIGLIALIGFAYFMFSRYKLTQKQKRIIELKEKETEKQKELIEEKQKEIIDSITYAKRLQQAILPPHHDLKKLFPEHFLIYLPKDIVAGDFYWSDSINNKHFIAAADSTGHGVPGALVSVVCSNALNRALKEFNLTRPSEILDKTKELVIETFEKSESDVKDGMDISLLCIDYSNKIVEWSGSNNPLWYISDGQLHEIKPDKQPIGKSDHNKPFTNHHIEWKDDAQFFLFTDGFADQFGGEAGKKFKPKPFQNLLLSIVNHPQNEQARQIRNAFENWKGDHEQVDDICIIGIKI